MASKKKSLDDAKRAKKDEFYTQLEDIENELRHYKTHLEGKVVLCNCDDPYESNFFKYFALNFNHLGLKKLIATCYSGSPITGTQLSLFGSKPEEARTPYKAIITTVHDTTGEGGVDMFDVAELFRKGENKIERLHGNGDFRSPECIELLDEADIVITNPPFSLFREYVAQLIEKKKHFLIIGPVNAITYKEIFPLIKGNSMWLGYGFRAGNAYFKVSPDAASNYAKGVYDSSTGLVKFRNCTWFTNLEHEKRHEFLPLFKKYSADEFPSYDNYDAIEVSKTENIPTNYTGAMGVPITFLDKYCPEQFEIINLSRYLNDSKGMTKEFVEKYYAQGNTGQICEGHPDLCYYTADGKTVVPYMRVIIRHKHPEVEQ